MRTLEEVAAKTEAPIRSNNPAMYTCLRPTMSDSLPIGSRSALTVSVWAMTTHCTVGRSVSKWPAIVGNATLTVPKVITPVKEPRPTAANPHHL